MLGPVGLCSVGDVMMRSLPLVAPLLLALVLPAAAQGAVWIVDDDGGAGVDFVTIHDAVDAAADGDTILVKDGTYPMFSIFAKSLAI